MEVQRRHERTKKERNGNGAGMGGNLNPLSSLTFVADLQRNIFYFTSRLGERRRTEVFAAGKPSHFKRTSDPYPRSGRKLLVPVWQCANSRHVASSGEYFNKVNARCHEKPQNRATVNRTSVTKRKGATWRDRRVEIEEAKGSFILLSLDKRFPFALLALENSWGREPRNPWRSIILYPIESKAV